MTEELFERVIAALERIATVLDPNPQAQPKPEVQAQPKPEVQDDPYCDVHGDLYCGRA